jgi:hypothetical protein
MTCLLIEQVRRGRAASPDILPRDDRAICAAFHLDHFAWLEYNAGTRQIADFIRQRTVADSNREVTIPAAVRSIHAWISTDRSTR